MGKRSDELGRSTPDDAIDRFDAAMAEPEPLSPGEIMAGGHGVVGDAGAENLPESTGWGGTSYAGASYAADTGDIEISDDGQTDDDIEATRAQIERTRSDMSETIDAIQNKLSPSNIAHQAKDTVKDATIGRAQDMVDNAQETAKGVGTSILDSIRENPVPAALAGIGLGWLFMSARQRSSQQTQYRGYRPAYGYDRTRGYTNDRTGTYNYPTGGQGGPSGIRGTVSQAQDKAGQVADQVQDTAGQVAVQVQQTAGQVADQVQQTAGQVTGQVQDTASQLANQAQYTAQRAQSGFQQMLYERPLAVGAAAVALGVAVGLAVPETEKENQLMGEARDTLVDRVQQQAQDTAQKVQNVAEEAVGAAKDKVQQEAQSQGLTQ